LYFAQKPPRFSTTLQNQREHQLDVMDKAALLFERMMAPIFSISKVSAVLS
jgi:hypothetical protein